MKVYCFYIVKNHISPKEYKAVMKDDIFKIGNNDCALYAYTPEKSSELYFISTRDMNLFFEKVIEMSRDDYEEFCEDHKEQLLEYHSFVSKKIVNNKYKSYNFQMLCTLLESDHILYYKEEIVMNYISDLFNDDIIDYINYHPFKKYIEKILDEFFLYDTISTKICPMEDINYDNFMIDDLSLYIKLFSNTFKRGE